VLKVTGTLHLPAHGVGKSNQTLHGDEIIVDEKLCDILLRVNYHH